MKHTNFCSHRTFALFCVCAGLGVLLAMMLSMRYTGRLQRMNADSSYSGGPMYGFLQLPNGERYSRDPIGGTTTNRFARKARMHVRRKVRPTVQKVTMRNQ